MIIIIAMILCNCTEKPLVISDCPRPASVLLEMPVKPDSPQGNEQADVLRHTAKYGAWCQQLEKRLLLLGDWHRNDGG